MELLAISGHPKETMLTAIHLGHLGSVITGNLNPAVRIYLILNEFLLEVWCYPRAPVFAVTQAPRIGHVKQLCILLGGGSKNHEMESNTNSEVKEKFGSSSKRLFETCDSVVVVDTVDSVWRV